MSWYIKVLKQYADFNGRARRKEYWMFVLFNIIFSIIISIIELAIGMIDFAVLSLIYSLAVLIPSLAVTVRRLHDTGRSGWWFFISFIPFVGSIILLVFMCLDSQWDQNHWGPNPKNVVPVDTPPSPVHDNYKL